METINAAGMPPLPAWFWFIEFFKVLGFILHMVPMNLWFAGTLLALVLSRSGGEPSRRFGSRLMRQMPVIVSLGINFGIVPLLFLQVAYSRAFYPATILTAWAWLAIIVLLIPAYYGVYLYRFGLGDDGAAMTRAKRIAGWTAAALFVVIGFLFANGLSLTTRVDAWRELWLHHSVGGAATGTALNLTDPTLWPRWLLMFGLALVTVAGWCVVDATWLARGENDDYRRWARGFALHLALVGAGWATLSGGWYMALLWQSEAHGGIFSFPLVMLIVVTAASPWGPWLVLRFWKPGELDRAKAVAVGGAQLGVLALNAISRQIVQNLELGALFKPGVSAQPVDPEWGSMILFLVTFAVGVAVIAWILAQLSRASPSAPVQ